MKTNTLSPLALVAAFTFTEAADNKTVRKLPLPHGLSTRSDLVHQVALFRES